MQQSQDDDLIALDDTVEDAFQAGEAWQILVVDDDEDVHAATAFSLSGATIHGRALSFTHARSAQAAIACLEQRADIHLILLDMVMERADSGLEVARWLREVAGRYDVPTIVLRSGQPGMLASEEVRRNPYINAFIEKQHASRARLIDLLERFLRAETAS